MYSASSVASQVPYGQVGNFRGGQPTRFGQCAQKDDISVSRLPRDEIFNARTAAGFIHNMTEFSAGLQVHLLRT